MHPTLPQTLGRSFLSTLLVVMLVGYLSARQAAATEYGTAASIGLRETYDDNVYLGGHSDFIHRVTPSLALSAVSDRAEFQVAASYDVKRYQDHDELNEVDNFYQVLASFEATPRLSFALVGTFVIDYTFLFALEQEGILAPAQLEEGGDRRLRVGVDRARDGDQVVPPC